MADIDIVPKHRSRTWLWVVLALIVVALLFWMMGGRTDAPTRGSLRGGPGLLALHVAPGHPFSVG